MNEKDLLIKPKKDKKPVVFFAVGSKEYAKYAIPFWRSMSKFHSPKDIPMLWYTNEKDPEVLKRLPEGIQLVDLDPLLADPAFYYRQKPVIMDTLLDEYELVCGFDSDQLILGDLNIILEANDYDVGTVFNFNRYDMQFYAQVEMNRIGIAPQEMFNCSLVAVRSKQFAHNWFVNCFTPQFDRMQYKEQDILNIMCYFGNWNVRAFDLPRAKDKPLDWYGIVAKGELARSTVKDGKIIIPQGLGDTPYPPNEVQLHAITLGGGHGALKDNWAQHFPPEVMIRIQEIIA